MSLKTSQIIIISLAGLSTAIGVAWATIQSGSIEVSNPPLTESAVSDEKAISAIPKNSTESQKYQPQPAAKNSPVESSLIPEISNQKVEPVLIEPPDTGCQISMAVINDPSPPLNVRSHPRVTDSRIVGKLKNNSFVSVTQEQNGWLRITEPPGWIAKNRTESSCPNVKQPINFLPGGDEVIVKGRIIGTGRHSYRILVTKNQTMTVRNRKDVFPQILTPDGQLLAGDPYRDNQTEWTGKMPVTGNYTLEFYSVFRGYEYEVSVQVR
jgi:hypothetical protein